ncbi:MAG: outer membrane beta-barrel protein [Ectothiorhodospiraceae bacterium]|nr:outer membrane beta-barrel protein [Ectothiorhodospiraceae bacterium]
MKNTLLLAATMSGILSAQTVMAEDFKFEPENLYFSLGATVSKLDEDGFGSASGYQISAGYDLPYKFADAVHTAIEVGYMNSGTFDAKPTLVGTSIVTPGSEELDSLWVSGVASISFSDLTKMAGVSPSDPSSLELFARLGYDFGDDDGIIYGAGLEYEVTEQISVNGEIVVGSEVKTGIFNLTYHMD